MWPLEIHIYIDILIYVPECSQFWIYFVGIDNREFYVPFSIAIIFLSFMLHPAFRMVRGAKYLMWNRVSTLKQDKHTRNACNACVLLILHFKYLNCMK